MTRRPMTREAFLDALLALPSLGDWPQVSPDGRWVAWVWLRVGPAADVWVAPTDGSQAPQRLTGTPENTFAVSWTFDSQALIVEQDRGGNERAQLFRVRLDRPNELEPLTEPDPPYFVRGGQLHPNGRWLVYGANYDFSTRKPLEPTWIYRHDLETGERVPLAKPRRGAWVWPELNVQGTHVLYTRKDRHPAGQQAWLVDVEGREDREILNFGDRAKVEPSWLPDGRRVLFLVEREDKTRALGLWDLHTERVEWLIDDPQEAQYIERAFVPFGSDYAVVVAVREARLRPYLLHVGTGERIELPEIRGNLLPLAPCPDPESGGKGEEWVGVYFSSTHPHDVVRFSPLELSEGAGPEAFRSLSRVWERTPLRPEDFVPAEDVRWRSGDGLEIQGWLYRARVPEGERPKGTIVYVHGGPTAHSSDSLNPQIQFFAHCGFNVLDPNYRGSTGFGLEFQEKIKEDGWGGREQEDIKTGAEALIARGIAEPGRIGVTGTSYGGYSAWCQITRYSPVPIAAAAPVCGMTDLIVDYETTRPDLRPYSEEMLGGSPDEIPEKYRERSPIHFVQNIRGKLLIVQGLQDPNVTPANVEAVRRRLDEAGIEYEVLAFEDEGHGILRPKNLKTLYLKLVEFFERALAQGRPS